MDDLQLMRVTKLRELAKEKHIQKYYKMNKAELLNALKNYTEEPKTKEKEKYIKPLKRSPLMDAKIEFTHMMKVLEREPKKTRSGFTDIFKGEEITFQFFKGERVRLVITKNDLVKTFNIEKNCIEMWNEILNYLKEIIYYIGEFIEAMFEKEPQKEEILELVEVVNNAEKIQKPFEFPRSESNLSHPQRNRPIQLGRRAPSTLTWNRKTRKLD